MSWRATILTLYPEMFPGHLGQSLAGRALAQGTWACNAVNIRDFAMDKHRTVDDTPAGGGFGMVLKVDVLSAAIDAVADGRPVLAMTPRGKPSLRPTCANWQTAPAPSSCAAVSKVLTNASSNAAPSKKCRLATMYCLAARLPRWL